MSLRCGTAGRAALAGMAIAWAAGRLEAGTARIEDVSLELPEGWRAIEPPEGAAAAWTRSSGSGIDASLVVEVHARASPARHDLRPAEKQAIERILGAGPALPGFRLIDHGTVDVDGVPAYRIRGRIEIDGRAMEQLQLVLSGPRTALLTFSWEGGRGEEDCDAMARSLRVDRSAGLPAGDAASGLAGILGLLAGMALAARRMRRRVRS